MTPISSYGVYAQTPVNFIVQSSSSPLQDRVTKWNGSGGIFGAAYLAFLADALFKFIGSLWTCVETPEQEGLIKTCTLNGVALGGALSNSIHWADSVNIISIGGVASVAKCLGYGASAVIAFVGVIDAIQQYFCPLQDEETRTQHQLLALLQLGYRVFSLAWAVLGITSVVIGESFTPVGAFLFFVSFLFYIAEFIYHSRIHQPEQVRGPLPSTT